MDQLKPLPTYLRQRYKGWKATTYEENRAWYERLATDGQRPRAMVIACCDSRVNVTSIFDADHGEFFIHRNIANLVPPFDADGGLHGTSAAVEYAVNVLKVAHLIIMGHSQCGGVQGCIDMCKGDAPDLDKPDSFVGRWMDILRPKFDEVADINDAGEQVRQMEQLAVKTSMENLLTFPYVAEKVQAGSLTLHGLWFDILKGELEFYENSTQHFRPVD